ncbi:hypothetical protein M1D83_06265 [Enterobacteriaceae bacterium]
MKKFLALSLLALFNIIACTQDRAAFDLTGDTIIDKDDVCIYVKDAEPGDVFTQYAIYPVHETNPRRYYVILPAYEQCLPNRNYESGKTWAAEYILMKPGGALRRYSVEFIAP